MNSKEKKWNVLRFTLIELVTVIAIMLILAGIALPAYNGIRNRANKTKAVAEIQSFVTAIASFQTDMGRLPKTLDELVVNPGAGGKWQGPYLQRRKIQKDPWQNDYVYQVPSKEGGAGSYDIISYGSDGTPGGTGNAKDIDNWPDDEE
jgi:general secretion pathway protein G